MRPSGNGNRQVCGYPGALLMLSATVNASQQDMIFDGAPIDLHDSWKSDKLRFTPALVTSI